MIPAPVRAAIPAGTMSGAAMARFVTLLTCDARTQRGPEMARADGPRVLRFLGLRGTGRVRLADGRAIPGARRAEILAGTGRQPGRQAGRPRDGGRKVVRRPIRRDDAMWRQTLAPQP